MSWIVIWRQGKDYIDFMRDGEGRFDRDDKVSEFETEEEAQEAAEATPAASVWPYVVVEAP